MFVCALHTTAPNARPATRPPLYGLCHGQRHHRLPRDVVRLRVLRPDIHQARGHADASGQHERRRRYGLLFVLQSGLRRAVDRQAPARGRASLAVLLERVWLHSLPSRLPPLAESVRMARQARTHVPQVGVLRRPRVRLDGLGRGAAPERTLASRWRANGPDAAAVPRRVVRAGVGGVYGGRGGR